MRLFSLRSRTVLHRILIALLVLVILLLLTVIGLFFYLQRYLVYTKDGVYLDFDRPAVAETEAPPAVPTLTVPPAPIQELEPAVTTEHALSTVLSGYTVSYSLLKEPAALLELCDTLEPCTLMLDAKDGTGNFYYSSALSDQGGGSQDLLSALVPELKKRGFYLIARVSAFRDRSFGLNNVRCGLPLASGALWMDEGGCYWLDPMDETVRVRLSRVCSELFSLGFDEIALCDFCIPISKNIVYAPSEGKVAVISSAAEALQSTLAGLGPLDFILEPDQSIPDPGEARLMMQTDDALLADTLRNAKPDLADAQFVFLTDSRDTRFSPYGLLRALEE